METGVHVSIQIRSVCNGNWSACFHPNKECLQWRINRMQCFHQNKNRDVISKYNKDAIGNNKARFILRRHKYSRIRISDRFILRRLPPTISR